MPHTPDRVAERTDRLDALLDERSAAAVWFRSGNGVAWLTGADSVVSRGSATGVACAGYVPDDSDADSAVRLLTTNIEANRIREEETPANVSVEAVPWYETSFAEAIAERSPTPALVDVPIDADPGENGGDSGVADIETFDPSTVRQPLSSADVAEYRELARETAAAVESICRELEPDDTERDVAAALRVALFQRGIETPVALVGGGDRAPKYRHYTPQDVRLGDYALVSVTAQRNGLHTSTTRTVAFDPPDWLAERHEVAMGVETAALEATQRVGRDGGTAGEVFAAVQDAYADAGWADEWRNHHQGGAAGYAGREWKATPTSDAPVHLPMGYAWNPTVQGAKSEDTVLVTEDEVDVLSKTGAWPTETVTAPAGEVEVERHLPLEA